MKLCLNMVFFDMPANETEVNGKIMYRVGKNI